MIFLRKYIILLLSFLFLLYNSKIIYSQSYIVCNTTISNSCLIGLYRTDNSHAALCNQTTLFRLGCAIVNNQYIIPIAFSSDNCQNNPAIYLNNVVNSHVGYAITYDSNVYARTYPVCLGNYFREVLNITTETKDSYFLLGLYRLNNSHVTLNPNAPIKINLKILDLDSPIIQINYTDRYISLPMALELNFSDNKYLYYCQVYVNNRLYDFSNNCRFSSFYRTILTINQNDCPLGLCNVTLISLDLAGNMNQSTYIYQAINPCLSIEAYPLTGNSILIVDFSIYSLKLRILNPTNCYGNFTDIVISFPDSDCNNLILVDGLQKRTFFIDRLNNGEFYEISTKIIPLRSGRCNFVITVEGYVEGTNIKQTYKKEIPLSIFIRTSVGLLIISEPLYGIIIALLIISLILFL